MKRLMTEEIYTKLNGVFFAPKLRGSAGLSGNRRSSAKGSSVEFSDYREYLPGDDTRRIDWNAYGRFEKLYVKQYMEEQELPVNFILDNSGSMLYGKKDKEAMGIGLLESMAYLALKNQDVVYVALSQGMKDSVRYRGRQSMKQLRAYADANQAEKEFSDSFSKQVQNITFHGPGLTFLITDGLFLDDMNKDKTSKSENNVKKDIEKQWNQMLDYLLYKRQSVVLFHVMAKEEIQGFTDELANTIELMDMEQGETLRLSLTKKHLKEYQKRVVEYQRQIEQALVTRGMYYIPVQSDESLDQVLFEQMKKTGLLTR